MALRTLGFFLAVDEGFALVLTFFADVLEDRHGRLQIPLESICGAFANSRLFDSNRVGASYSVSGSALSRRWACADDCQFSAAAQGSPASARRAVGRGRTGDQSSLLVLLARCGAVCRERRPHDNAHLDCRPRPRR